MTDYANFLGHPKLMGMKHWIKNVGLSGSKGRFTVTFTKLSLSFVASSSCKCCFGVAHSFVHGNFCLNVRVPRLLWMEHQKCWNQIWLCIYASSCSIYLLKTLLAIILRLTLHHRCSLQKVVKEACHVLELWEWWLVESKSTTSSCRATLMQR